MSQEHPARPAAPAAPTTPDGQGAYAGPYDQQPGYAPQYGYAPQPPAPATQHPDGQEHLPARTRRLWSTTVVAVVAAACLVLGGLLGAGAATWGANDAGPGSFQPGENGQFPGGQFPGQDSGTSDGSSL